VATCAQPQTLQIGQAPGVSGRVAVDRYDGLRHGVVRRGEVDRLLAFLGDRELGDVEVEWFVAGLDGNLKGTRVQVTWSSEQPTCSATA